MRRRQFYPLGRTGCYCGVGPSRAVLLSPEAVTALFRLMNAAAPAGCRVLPSIFEMFADTSVAITVLCMPAGPASTAIAG